MYVKHVGVLTTFDNAGLKKTFLHLNKQSYLYCRDALPLNNNVAHPSVQNLACEQCVITPHNFVLPRDNGVCSSVMIWCG